VYVSHNGPPFFPICILAYCPIFGVHYRLSEENFLIFGFLKKKIDLLKKKLFLRRGILSEEDIPVEPLHLKLSEEDDGSSQEKRGRASSSEEELNLLKKFRKYINAVLVSSAHQIRLSKLTSF